MDYVSGLLFPSESHIVKLVILCVLRQYLSVTTHQGCSISGAAAQQRQQDSALQQHQEQLEEVPESKSKRELLFPYR